MVNLNVILKRRNKKKERREAWLCLLASLVEERPRNAGSVPGRKVVYRERVEGHNRLMRFYFNTEPEPIYDDKAFRRRYRMSKRLFNRILSDMLEHNDFYKQKRDATHKLGASPHQKLTAAMRQLAYGISADALDEIIGISAELARESLLTFCQDVVDIYEEEYLRRPTQEDVDRLLKENKKRGFPGMLGSLDCMHWKWKNCPVAWQGMYEGKEKEPTVVLEAVASKDLWIWHAFFGCPGTLNDINILDRSHLFHGITHYDNGPTVEYEVNGNKYNLGYYLADGIYPKYSTLIQTIPNPIQPKDQVSMYLF